MYDRLLSASYGAPAGSAHMRLVTAFQQRAEEDAAFQLVVHLPQRGQPLGTENLPAQIARMAAHPVLGHRLTLLAVDVLQHCERPLGLEPQL